ncbi:NADAR family protein [Solirubrobacter soli]|uniref:NADAR family protein n=1 Tax=Solirubrobacter soli TaxID=363832 RepID=UPI00040236F0|nr:NADAR family protein [Solirubrobacter soli]
MADPLPRAGRDRIDRFDNTTYEFLGNFYASTVRIRADRQGLELIECATVEHGFQACKALEPDQRRLIAAAPTPAQAKRLGRRASLRPDWEQVREDVMRRLLAQKFRLGEPLALRLLATGNADLVEGNHGGDRRWGVSEGIGQNRLGQLLMQRRAELRTALREQTPAPCGFWTAAPGGDEAAPRDPQGLRTPDHRDRERDRRHERR